MHYEIFKVNLAYYICVCAGICLWICCPQHIASDIYQLTPHLWRTFEDMQSYFPFMLISELAFAIIFALFYAYLQERMRVSLKGWQYGLGIGAIFASIQFGVYVYLPISFTLTLLWVVDALVEPILCGVLLSYIYKK